jgi:hypothetical protein
MNKNTVLPKTLCDDFGYVPAPQRQSNNSPCVSVDDPVMSSFWSMLQECEQTAQDNQDPVLKHFVNQWYMQWNDVTGSDNQPRWKSK